LLKRFVLANLNSLLPARQGTAQDELEKALVELGKTVVYGKKIRTCHPAAPAIR